MVAFFVATLGIYAFWWVLHFVIPNKLAWRQYAFGLWTSSFVKISRMRVTVKGTPPKTPYFLVSNHLSYTDIAALRYAVVGVFVAKAEIKTWPVAGRIIRDMGTVFIDRSNRRDIPRAGEEIMDRLDHGEGIIIFPEGTSTSGANVLPFNSSFFEFAVERGIAVAYASISYKTPPGDLEASKAVCWGEDISFFAHLYRLFHVREYEAVITFGNEAIRGDDRKLLARELHTRIEEIFEPVL